MLATVDEDMNEKTRATEGVPGARGWLTRREVAELLGWSLRKVDQFSDPKDPRWADTGAPLTKYRRPGEGVSYFDKAEVTRYAADLRPNQPRLARRHDEETA